MDPNPNYLLWYFDLRAKVVLTLTYGFVIITSVADPDSVRPGYFFSNPDPVFLDTRIRIRFSLSVGSGSVTLLMYATAPMAKFSAALRDRNVCHT